MAGVRAYTDRRPVWGGAEGQRSQRTWESIVAIVGLASLCHWHICKCDAEPGSRRRQKLSTAFPALANRVSSQLSGELGGAGRRAFCHTGGRRGVSCQSPALTRTGHLQKSAETWRRATPKRAQRLCGRGFQGWSLRPEMLEASFMTGLAARRQ